MNTQIIAQEERTEEDEQLIIKQLRESIQLSHHQMHQLVSNQECFVQKITAFNNISKQKINKKTQLEISEALVYLAEAQKILQYAAGCGKNINRQLIICVLHNQACVYQILWQLDQCSNYLQALIYNYESFFKQSSEFSVSPSYIVPSSQSQINSEPDKMFGFAGGSQIQYTSRLKDPQLTSKTQLKLLNYYYQHCAVSSQLQKNRKALQSAKKAIKLLKSSFYERKTQLIQGLSHHKTYLDEISEQKYFLLLKLSEMSQKINVDQFEQIFKSAHFSLQIWTNNRTGNHGSQVKQNQHQKVKQKLKNLAIGTIMEILPKTFNKLTNQAFVGDEDENIFTLEECILRVFFLSVGYFSVATELRILANLNYKNRKEEEKKNSAQYKQSIIYHLIAIIIAALYIPYECHYILDILASYSKHYSCYFQEYKPVQEQSIQKILLLLGFKEEEEETKNRKDLDKMGRSTKQTSDSQRLIQANQYNMNCNNNVVFKSKIHKNKQSNSFTQPQKQKHRTKQLKTDLRNSQIKKQRVDSKNSRMKRSNSKQTVNIKDKVQKKYSQLQRILTSENLLLSQETQHLPIKKLKSAERQKQKSHHMSKDKIYMKKITQKQRQKDQTKKPKNEGKNVKNQRKTKNSQKKIEQKAGKANSITQQDQQFFFYMSKKTTKTNLNQNGNLFSPKQSLKSIGSSRRSVNKKSSVYSSRSNSKNSPKVFQNIQSPVGSMQSPMPRALNNIKRITGQKKVPGQNLKPNMPTVSSSTYRNYF